MITISITKFGHTQLRKKRSEASCQWWATLILRLAVYSTLSLAVRLAVTVALDQTDPPLVGTAGYVQR